MLKIMPQQFSSWFIYYLFIYYVVQLTKGFLFSIFSYFAGKPIEIRLLLFVLSRHLMGFYNLF